MFAKFVVVKLQIMFKMLGLLEISIDNNITQVNIKHLTAPNEISYHP